MGVLAYHVLACLLTSFNPFLVPLTHGESALLKRTPNSV